MNSFDSKIPLYAPYAFLSALFLQLFLFSCLGNSSFFLLLQQIFFLCKEVIWGLGFLNVQKSSPCPQEKVEHRHTTLLWRLYILHGSWGAILFALSRMLSPWISLFLNFVLVLYFAWETCLNLQ